MTKVLSDPPGIDGTLVARQVCARTVGDHEREEAFAGGMCMTWDELSARPGNAKLRVIQRGILVTAQQGLLSPGPGAESAVPPTPQIKKEPCGD